MQAEGGASWFETRVPRSSPWGATRRPQTCWADRAATARSAEIGDAAALSFPCRMAHRCRGLPRRLRPCAVFPSIIPRSEQSARRLDTRHYPL